MLSRGAVTLSRVQMSRYQRDTCSTQTSLFSSFSLVSQISISSSTLSPRSLLWVSDFSILFLRLRTSSCRWRGRDVLSA